jgi:thioesterase domain-containing protein
MIRFIAIGLAAACAALGLAGCSGSFGPALSYSASARAPAERLPGRVYLLRGLIGDVFSLGMDELAEKIERRGVRASVHGVSAVVTLADSIVAEYRANPRATAPIVLVGHSTGGDAIIAIAHKLKAADVPVAIAFGFDPTPVAARVPGNVDLFINLYQGTNLIGGGTAKPDRDFRGRLVNVDLRERREIVHITLDKSDAIHDLVVRKIVNAAQQAQAQNHPVREASSAPRDRRRKAAQPAPAYVTPLAMRYVVPQSQTIELWDSAVRAKAEPGETLAALAQRNGAPAWAVAQVNKLDTDAPLREGQELLIPRNRLSSPADIATPAPH